MEGFLNRKCYVRVQPAEWAAFAAMCDAAGLRWPAGMKASGHTPRAVRMGKAMLSVVAADGYLLVLPNDCAGSARVVAFADLAPLANKAVIVADGRRITARRIADKRTVKAASATCSPDDTFRFGPGALLALYRTLETEEDRSLAMRLIAEDRIQELEAEVPNIRELIGAPKKNSRKTEMDAIGDAILAGLEEALKPLGAKVVIRRGVTGMGRTAFMDAVEKALRGSDGAEDKKP